MRTAVSSYSLALLFRRFYKHEILCSCQNNVGHSKRDIQRWNPYLFSPDVTSLIRSLLMVFWHINRLDLLNVIIWQNMCLWGLTKYIYSMCSKWDHLCTFPQKIICKLHLGIKINNIWAQFGCWLWSSLYSTNKLVWHFRQIDFQPHWKPHFLLLIYWTFYIL